MKYKFKLWNYSVYENDTAEEILNNMAKGGYELQDISHFPSIACFVEKEGAKHIRYSVICRTEDIMYIPEEYQNCLEDTGWKYVAETDKGSRVYKTTDDKKHYPIYSDNKSKMENMLGGVTYNNGDVAMVSVRKRVLFTVLFAAVLAWNYDIITAIVLLLIFVFFLTLQMISTFYCKHLVETDKGNIGFLKGVQKISRIAEGILITVLLAGAYGGIIYSMAANVDISSAYYFLVFAPYLTLPLAIPIMLYTLAKNRSGMCNTIMICYFIFGAMSAMSLYFIYR